jgi:hypothetical protein
MQEKKMREKNANLKTRMQSRKKRKQFRVFPLILSRAHKTSFSVRLIAVLNIYYFEIICFFSGHGIMASALGFFATFNK